MTYQLAPSEKMTIITQHLRTLAFSKYNYEVSLLEEQSVAEPNQETIDSLNQQLGFINSKITALIAETVAIEGNA